MVWTGPVRQMQTHRGRNENAPPDAAAPELHFLLFDEPLVAEADDEPVLVYRRRPDLSFSWVP
jgi:hypothetical protein